MNDMRCDLVNTIISTSECATELNKHFEFLGKQNYFFWVLKNHFVTQTRTNILI